MIAVEVPTLFHPQCLSCKRADAERGPYVDFTRDYDHDHQGRMYECRVCVETAAATLGLPTSLERDDLQQRLSQAEAELADMQAELESLREFERSAKYTLERFGEKPRKKPGRKPNQPEPTTA